MDGLPRIKRARARFWSANPDPSLRRGRLCARLGAGMMVQDELIQPLPKTSAKSNQNQET